MVRKSDFHDSFLPDQCLQAQIFLASVRLDFFLPEQNPAVQGNESQSAFQPSKILITGKQKADL